MDSMTNFLANAVYRQKLEIKRILESAFVERDLESRLLMTSTTTAELKADKLYILSCDESEQRIVHEGFEIKVLPIWHNDVISKKIMAGVF